MAMLDKLDRRLTPARADLAATSLRGKVEAARYADPAAFPVIRAHAGLFRSPDAEAPFDTVLLLGERFDVYEFKDGWAWGQAVLDDYVGFVPAKSLAPVLADPTHAVSTLGCQLYKEPRLKLPPIGALPFAARVRVVDTRDGYAHLANGLWAPERLLRPLDQPAPDWVAVAEQFQGVPYVWGGRSSTGIDCSGLVQLALQPTGRACPRDSDMQEAALGQTLDAGAELARGDLIFWRGHVGLMCDATTLLHANAHHMATAREPLATAIERIAAAGDGAVTRRARLNPDE